MPTVECRGCGRDTNSALASLPDPSDEKPGDWGKFADWCYATWDEATQKWTKGCGYDRPDAALWMQRFADRYIGQEHPD
jgi:hypothetical protein